VSEQTKLPLFVKSNISQVFILSLDIFEPTTTWSRCQYIFIMLKLQLVFWLAVAIGLSVDLYF